MGFDDISEDIYHSLFSGLRDLLSYHYKVL